MASEELEQIDKAVHDLCQPLTTLQCHLELASLLQTPEAYCQAVQSALAEFERIADGISVMRDAVRAAVRGEEGEQPQHAVVQP